MNILLTKDDIHTLTNIFIADPMWADLLPKSCATQGYVVLMWLKPKKRTIMIDIPLINSSL
jgi:hypothetical protein